MGARLRIKASYSLSRFTGQALTIAKAGKKFGYIVMDGGPPLFQLEGETGTCWNAKELAAINTIPTSALEVVETGNVIAPPQLRALTPATFDGALQQLDGHRLILPMPGLAIRPHLYRR